MGIDIYAHWRNQTEAEGKAQFTGFSTVSGDVGYLREAYHGAPYVTKYLVAEAFKNGDASIKAEELRKRLPVAVLMALYRNHVVYDSKDEPGIKSFDDLLPALANIFENEIDDSSHEEVASWFKKEHLDLANKLILKKLLPDYAQTFVVFVELCEAKEKETGEPCKIHASY